ncbi:MAG TPA: hypothetical protein VLO31_05890 [Cryobacterium sp.]|nr:hypothetical protein [Cryobacterium sp.]
MSSEVLGGGVMIAVAAALWVAYLMPTWARRRQYLTTERNAVRLQQTMRILAETSEVPQQVRLEANARTVVTQRKLLAQAEDDARAEAKAVTDAAASARRSAAALAAANRAAASRLVAAQAAAVRDDAARAGAVAGSTGRALRLRRVRALTSLFLLVGVIVFVSGIVAVAAGGAVTALVAGLATVVLALGTLSRLARTARRARQSAVATNGSEVRGRTTRVGQAFEPVQLEETPVVAPSWTPLPLPRPMHLSRGSVAQAAMASVDAAAELRKAAAEAELARRAAALEVAVTPLKRASPGSEPVPAAPAASRFASMGVVGDTAPGMSDLDDVLRRRRAVG